MNEIISSKSAIELGELQEMVKKISEQVERNDVDSALAMNVIAYERALAIDNPSIICEILFNFGVIEDLKGQSQKAMSFFTKSLTLAQESENLKYIIMALNKMASIYGLYGEFRKSIDAYSEILEIIEVHPEARYKKSVTYNNMGLAFLNLQAYDDAEKYYKLALTSSLESPTDNRYDHVVVAIIYSNLAEIFLHKKEYEEAEKHLNLSRQQSVALDDYVGVAFCFHLEAILFHERDQNWEKAESLFDQALDLMSKCGADYEVTDIMIKYGNQAFKANQLALAQELLEKANVKASEHQYIKMEPEICDVLEKIYLHNKQYKEAHLMARRQLEVKTLFNEQWGNLTAKKFVKDVREEEENRQLEELKRSIRTMKMLAEVGQTITASIDITQAFEVVSETLVKIMNLSSLAISLINEDQTSLTIKVYDDGNFMDLYNKLDSDSSFMVWCVRNQREIIIYSPRDILLYHDIMNAQLVERLENSLLKSLLFCPMYNGDQIIGGVTVQSEKPFNFSYVDLEALRLLTSYIAIATNNILKSQKLLQTNKKLEAASRIDGLTGLLNRRALGDYIENDFASTLDTSLPVTMVMLDLDYFKQYNDFYGHNKGDLCLISVSNAIKETVEVFPNKHFAFRFGGDEFLIILENCSEDMCQEMLNNLFERTKSLHIEHLRSKIDQIVTLTAGASVVKRHLTDYTEVFSNADEAMYMAKNGGRNRFEIFVLK